MKGTLLKYYLTTVLLAVGGLCNAVQAFAPPAGDTIPLQATQTATRTVELTWDAAVETHISRRYPGESVETEIGVTTGTTFTDHHARAVCDDTVHYSISQTVAGIENNGYVAVNVLDMDATSAAEWGVVTVENQSIELDWVASADSDIMGYMICEGMPSMVIDTVFGRENTHYSATQYSCSEAFQFRICAFDTCRQASALTDNCNNIVLTLSSAPCSRTVNAVWNSYVNMPGGVHRYEVWISENGGEFRLAATTTDAVSANFDVAESTMSLVAYVKAVGTAYESKSNRQEYTFSTAERPAYLYLRKVTCSDAGDRVTVIGQTDPSFAAGDYKVYRSEDGGAASVVGHCQSDAQGMLRWEDYSVRPKEHVYTYCFGVEDGCGRNEIKTQKGSTLLLELESSGDDVAVQWNAYEGWSGTTVYELMACNADDGIWTSVGAGIGQEMLDAGGVTTGTRRYKVVATEGYNSQYMLDDSLQSAVFEMKQLSTVWMANAFMPDESSNNRFGPKFNYMDAEGYLFAIYNRYGVLIFSTSNPDDEWDGRLNGVAQPAGAYVYALRFRQSDGTIQEMKGTVTLIR